MPRPRLCSADRGLSAGQASKRSVALRAHAFALADKLGCTLTEDADAKPQSLRRCIVTWPIDDLLTYYVALHELGHDATWTLETMRPADLTEREPLALAARELLGEARAWAWALDVAEGSHACAAPRGPSCPP